MISRILPLKFALRQAFPHLSRSFLSQPFPRLNEDPVYKKYEIANYQRHFQLKMCEICGQITHRYIYANIQDQLFMCVSCHQHHFHTYYLVLHLAFKEFTMRICGDVAQHIMSFMVARLYVSSRSCIGF